MEDYLSNSYKFELNNEKTSNYPFGFYSGGNSFEDVDDPQFKNVTQPSPNLASVLEYFPDQKLEIKPETFYELEYTNSPGDLMNKVFIVIDGFKIKSKKTSTSCALPNDLGLKLLSSMKIITDNKNVIQSLTGDQILHHFQTIEPPKFDSQWLKMKTEWGDSKEYTELSFCKNLGVDPTIKDIKSMIIPLPFGILPLPVYLLTESGSSIKFSFSLANIEKLITTNDLQMLELPKVLNVRFIIQTLIYSPSTPPLIRSQYFHSYKTTLVEERDLKIMDTDKTIELVGSKPSKYSPIVCGFHIEIKNKNFTSNMKFFGHTNNDYMKNYIFSHFKFNKNEHNLLPNSIDLKSMCVVNSLLMPQINHQFYTSGYQEKNASFSVKNYTPTRIEKIDEQKMKILLNVNNNQDEFWLTINSNLPFNAMQFPKNLFFDPQTIQMYLPEFTLLLFNEISLVFEQLDAEELVDQSICDGADDNQVIWVAEGFCAWPSLSIKLVDIQINRHSFPVYFTMIPLNNHINTKMHKRSILSTTRDLIVNNPSITGLDLDGDAQIPSTHMTSYSFEDALITKYDPILMKLQNDLRDPEFKTKIPKNLTIFDNRPFENSISFFDINTTAGYPRIVLNLDMTPVIIDGGFSLLKKNWVNLSNSADFNLSLKLHVLTKHIVKFSPKTGIKNCIYSSDIKPLVSKFNQWSDQTYGDLAISSKKRKIDNFKSKDYNGYSDDE